MRLPYLLLAVLIAAYAVFFGALSINRHDTFGTAGNDLGNMDQAVWNTSQGRWFESTNWRGGSNRLGAHVEPIMLPLALSYLVAPSPKTLLVIQSTLVALGAVPLFWLARRRLGSAWLALPFAAAYLLFPALQAATLYEFHPLTLTAPFFALGVAGLLERKTIPFVIGTVLAVACKEDMPLVAAGMGVYALVVQRRWRTGLATIGLSLAWFGVAMTTITQFNPTGSSPYLPRYRELGGSIPEIALTLLTQPWRALPLLNEGDPIAYLLALLLPVAGLALLAPAALLPIGVPLAANLLSSNTGQRIAEANHYPAPMLPFLVAAAILGAERLLRLGGSRRWVATTVAVAMLIVSLGYARQRGFTPLAVDFEVKPVTDHHRIAERLIAMVPADASVNATPQIDPHLTQRRRIVVWPWGGEADVMLWDTYPLNVPLVVQDQYDAAQRLLANGYGLVAAEDGLLLLQRGAASQARLEDAYQGYLAPAPPPRVASTIDFGESFQLIGYDVVQETPSTPYLVLHLRAGSRPDPNVKLFAVLDNGDAVQLAGPTFTPVTSWPAGSVFRALTPTYGRWRRPGTFEVRLIATNGGDPADSGSRLAVRVRDGDRLITAPDNIVSIATLSSDGRTISDITPARLRDLPDGVQRRDALLGDGISLAGASIGGCGGSPRPGCRLEVTLFWTAARRRDSDETVFLHLIGPDGTLAAQVDGPPAGGSRPTSGWLAGEIVADDRSMNMPANLGPGDYQLLVGLYNPVSGARIASSAGDSLPVGSIRLSP